MNDLFLTEPNKEYKNSFKYNDKMVYLHNL